MTSAVDLDGTQVRLPSGEHSEGASRHSRVEPLVSVCISAYNVERFVAEALGSVLAQSHRNIEVIVVDNGSEDRTYEIVKSVSDERVHSFRIPENIGGYQAMNKVASMAKSEFIAIYHSDDHYEPMIVEKELAYLQANPEVGAVFTMGNFMDEQGRIFGGSDLPREFRGKKYLTYADVFRFILRNKNILLWCPTFMIRREVFESVGPFNPEKYGIGSDLEMWIRIVRNFPIAILNERLIRYRVGKSQWSARYNQLRTERECTFPVMDDYVQKDGWAQKLGLSDWTEYEFHQCDDDTFRAASLIILGDLPGARKLLSRPYPWRTLLNGIRRRKLRLIALRTLIFAGLALGASRPLSHVLRRLGK